MKKASLNIPNTLSLIRALLVPVFVAALLFMRELGIWGCIVPAIVFIITGLTDMLDGKIARKYNLVTDFGKFIDPLADKFMVIGSQIAILVWMMLRAMDTGASSDLILPLVFVWVVLIILLRELGVTSLRLVVAGKSGIVVAASMLGKIKTVSQIVCVMAALLEPVLANINLLFFLGYYPITLISAFLTLVMTVWSGIVYIKTYWKYLDKNM